ncbi:ammonium transporter [Acinetobacter sichuanensis]|uniref:ammonium transporter n=1 Tax=Acinetobacter sichuanensis TaxID=2136183 RepID=UPI00280C5AA7|nr:ammonium transporter [Acinetobacter sichuanensis]MDQ9020405.1 ammonium transporter [Acinetobacter sichuanensis]
MKQLYLYLVLLFSSSQTYSLTTVSPAQFNAINTFSDITLIVLGTLFVLLMQAGFAVIEGGYVKNSRAIYNLGISYLSAILGNTLYIIFCFLLVFFGIWQTENQSNHIQMYWWQWQIFIFYILMSSTITTIVGRIIPINMSSKVYWIVGLLVSGVIFPILSVSAWGDILFNWHWLKDLGFIDYAGATVIHSFAAWIVLAGYVVFNQYHQDYPKETHYIFQDQKMLIFSLAGFVLWLAWSCLNVAFITGMTIDIITVLINIISVVFGVCVATLGYLILKPQKFKRATLIKALFGGLVAITASCGLVSMSIAFIIGFVAALMTCLLPKLLKRWIRIRSVADVIVIHGLCGVWGTLAVIMNKLDNSIVEVSWKYQIFGILFTFFLGFGLMYVIFKRIALHPNLMNTE